MNNVIILVITSILGIGIIMILATLTMKIRSECQFPKINIKRLLIRCKIFTSVVKLSKRLPENVNFFSLIDAYLEYSSKIKIKKIVAWREQDKRTSGLFVILCLTTKGDYGLFNIRSDMKSFLYIPINAISSTYNGIPWLSDRECLDLKKYVTEKNVC